tara:strand:+ start:2395 stop:2595 length:201 start_codon:yes stop_codon:yes gene_type:complete
MTKKESEVLKFIKNFIEENEYSPSYREITDYMKFKSISQTHKIIHQLIKCYKVKVIPAKRRSLELV